MPAGKRQQSGRKAGFGSPATVCGGALSRSAVAAAKARPTHPSSALQNFSCPSGHATDRAHLPMVYRERQAAAAGRMLPSATAELCAQLQSAPNQGATTPCPWGTRAASCWLLARACCRLAWTPRARCRAPPPRPPGAAACWCCACTAAACSSWPRSSCRTPCTLCACCGARSISQL